jgi:RimJ/RimL family protein N-acetyltransferase
MSVTTARLRLHPWDFDAHTDALAAANADPAVVRYLHDGVPYTYEESARQSARFEAHWHQHGFGLWALELISTGDIIGFAGLAHPMWFPALATEIEVGWRLHPTAWGHGYATEAGQAALATATGPVIAIIDPANTPSIAVATRLGMHPARTLPHPQRPGTVLIYQTFSGQPL